MILVVLIVLVRRAGGPVKLLIPKNSSGYSDDEDVSMDEDDDDEFLAQQREEYAKLFGLSISDMVNQKQDEEFFGLLERLEDLCDKLDGATLKGSHAAPFLCDTLVKVGQELAAKMREQAQVNF